MADPIAELRDGLRDRYAFERELGRGGMATVFLARDLRYDRPVALKVLHPELAASLGPDRFQREVRLAARLQHPHILTVLDSGETAGQLWFSMPYVEGESLRDRLRRERQLQVDDALRIAREAASALHYAHEHGVIHRDIKPENLLITRDGHTLVADFGIARSLAASEEKLTETGLAIGTPAYMSPEQAAGDRGLDARTDQYSLATVLYELLAGEAPFTGATAQAVVAKRLSGEIPRVRQVRPSVPEEVERAITRALAPVAADRYATTSQFAQALQPGGTASPAAAPTAVTPAESLPPAAPPTTAAPVARRRFPVAATALVLGILIGLGVLFAWRRSQGGAAGGARVLAVLPFENLGDSADAYFADGVTDEVRTKLAKVAGLYVIARGSSTEYRGSLKRAQEIAQELGAGYLLTGTVRWVKAADGSSRVRVAPELVELQPGQPPRTRWGEQFDAGITDIFQVQADIAGKVVSALDVALADSVRSELVARPTESVAAYDAYLKAEAAFTTGDSRGAIAWYQEAVRRDPDFALAWAHLTQAAALLSGIGATPELTALVHRAVERATSLAPDDPATHAARAFAESRDGTAKRALEIAEEGLRVAPNDADLLGVASLQEMTLGRFDHVVALLERAVAIDPRAAPLHRRIGYGFMVLRRYQEAQAAFERALAVAPGGLNAQQSLVILGLMQGDTGPGRRIAAEPAGATEDQMLAYLGQFEELFWALDKRHQDRLLELGPELFEDNRSAWALVRAHVYWTRGDTARARVWADTARIEFGTHLRTTPDDPQPLIAHATALAYVGRKAEAMREGERAVASLPTSKDMYIGPYLQHQLVRIYLACGEYEKALDTLEPLLKMPYTLTPAWLRIDPMFEPLRGHPRFRKLVEGTA
jgi:eukaryotic-like serine/threonine-protein kinase